MKIIRQFNNLKKPIKISIIVIFIVLLLIPMSTLSRMAYKLYLEHFYTTKNFYFKSDLLSDKLPEYTISNWSGVDSYVLTINMNSIKNDLVTATSDINYKISFKCDETITCELNKTTGVIRTNNGSKDNNNRDYFMLTITPKKTFINNEQASVEVFAESISPYKKKISAKFFLRVEKIGLSYEITDNKHDIFAILRLTNSLTYYTVITAFDDYQVGDELEQEVYASLSIENKKKCSSMLIDLQFDPKVISLDMTNAYYLESQKLGENYIKTAKFRTINKTFDDYLEGDLIDEESYDKLSLEKKKNISEPFDYISGFKVSLDAISSADIKFYKRDKTANYSFPFLNGEPVVSVK